MKDYRLIRERIILKLLSGLSSGASSLTLRNQRTDSDNGIYPEFVRRAVADTSVFYTFKHNPAYRQILEHTSKEQGNIYLDEIQRKWPEILEHIEQYKINDTVGSPILSAYPRIGDISPSTLRYLKVASDLHELFGDLTGFHVVEVGCGYGGQFLILDQLWNLGSHTFFDLDCVLQLIRRYLECHLINSVYRTSTLNRFGRTDESFDLAISNYAFSEMPKPLQLKYISKVLSKAKRGYMTMNTGKLESDSNRCLTIPELCQHFPALEILDEIPLTAPNNYIAVWGR